MGKDIKQVGGEREEQRAHGELKQVWCKKVEGESRGGSKCLSGMCGKR